MAFGDALVTGRSQGRRGRQGRVRQPPPRSSPPSSSHQLATTSSVRSEGAASRSPDRGHAVPPWHVRNSQRFSGCVAAGPGGRGVIGVPFDPDEVWGARAGHLVGGTINGRRVRGLIAPDGAQWTFTVTPMWMRDAGVVAGEDVIVELAPEGPQRVDLADDIVAALDADPAAAAFFDTLAQFYRKAYLRWIDATTRRPDLRAARIAETVSLLAAGIKERPRPPRQSPSGTEQSH
jgi:hypothetical protein